MTNFWLVIFGALSGVLGGMGMGGGTLLIPLLNFLDIPQQTVQAINLISFLPMAMIALAVHFKNGLAVTKDTGYLIFPAISFAAVGAFLTTLVSGDFLRICFGILLLGLGIWQMSLSLKTFVADAKVKKIVNAQKKEVERKNSKTDEISE